MTAMRPSTSQEWVHLAFTILADKKGLDIVALDMRNCSMVADYFVLVCGANTPHLKSLANEIRQRFKALGLASHRQSGTSDSGWIVADYFDVVIHFFTPDKRRYYALEDLWHEAPRITLEEAAR